MQGGPTIFLAGALALMLLAAAWGDIRARTIPNALNGAIAAIAILWWWANGLSLWPDIALQIGCALIVFGLFAIAFAMGAMGGGDVKLITALALWLPLAPLTQMLVIMSLFGGLVTIAMLVWARVRRLNGRLEVPYGVAIAAAGLWVFANDVLTISSP